MIEHPTRPRHLVRFSLARKGWSREVPRPGGLVSPLAGEVTGRLVDESVGPKARHLHALACTPSDPDDHHHLHRQQYSSNISSTIQKQQQQEPATAARTSNRSNHHHSCPLPRRTHTQLHPCPHTHQYSIDICAPSPSPPPPHHTHIYITSTSPQPFFRASSIAGLCN